MDVFLITLYAYHTYLGLTRASILRLELYFTCIVIRDSNRANHLEMET